MAGSFWEYFLFYGLAGFFYSFGLKASVFLSKILYSLFPGILAAVSIHLITSTAVRKTPVLLFRPEFGMRFDLRSRWSLSTKLISFFPISVDEKGCYFRLRVLANHLASFFRQAIRSDSYLFHPSEVTGYR